MASKLAMKFQPAQATLSYCLMQINLIQPHSEPRRYSSKMIPATQYDAKIPPRLRFGHAVYYNWEVIPLFAVTAAAMAALFFSIYWALNNKVDVVYTPNTRDNLSRTMDLEYPRSHKIITINQEYKPWPEMINIQDMMIKEEKKQKKKAPHCMYTMPS